MKQQDELLRRACKAPEGKGEEESFNELVSGIRDWNSLLQKAVFHRLIPRLYFLLKQGGADSFLPAKIWDRIERAHRASQFQVFALEAELTQNLLPWFQQAGIEVLLLKGAALQQTVYRERPYRSFVDLDLMIHEENLATVRKILEEAGYEQRLSHFPSQWHVREFGLEAGEIAFPYLEAERGVRVDLHVEAFEGWLPFRFKKSWLWEKARPIEVEGSGAFLPEPNRLFLHLLFHLLKHRQAYENILGWYLDLDQVLRHFEKEIDGSFCLAMIQKNPGENQIHEILAFLHQEFKTPLPLPLEPPHKEMKAPLVWNNFFFPIRPSEITRFNRPRGTDGRELFIYYWNRLRGLRKKIMFVLRWLLPDAGYLKAKYPFQRTPEKLLAYFRHWGMMGLKAASLGFYWLTRERAGSRPEGQI